MLIHVVLPNSLLAFKTLVDVFDHLVQEGSCSGCGVKNLDFMNFLFNFNLP